MSATNRGAERVEYDFYATPDWCTKLISQRINWGKVKTACEPCRGDGAIVSALPDGLEWECYEIREGFDYLKSTPKQCDLTPTNPPFNFALEFLEKSLAHSLCVLYLLRLNFLGSEERKTFLKANKPTHQYVLSKRPSFVDICKGFPKTKTRSKIKSCGKSFPKTANIKKCPNCGGNVSAGTDATEYAWFAWDKGEIMLDLPGIDFL